MIFFKIQLIVQLCGVSFRNLFEKELTQQKVVKSRSKDTQTWSDQVPPQKRTSEFSQLFYLLKNRQMLS